TSPDPYNGRLFGPDTAPWAWPRLKTLSTITRCCSRRVHVAARTLPRVESAKPVWCTSETWEQDTNPDERQKLYLQGYRDGPGVRAQGPLRDGRPRYHGYPQPVHCARAVYLRSGLRVDGQLRKQDHVHRRRQGRPHVPRLSGRAARREEFLHRGG